MNKNMAQFDFSDKVVLITGAGGGIGRAAALAFAKSGAKLALADYLDSLGAETLALVRAQCPQTEVIYLHCDISNTSDVTQMVNTTVEHFGRLDFAFNNAGIEEESHPLGKGEEDLFDRIMGTNVKGTWLCMKYEIEQMLKQGGGAIVNTASVAGLIGAPSQSVYTASKHAVVGLTKSAAVAYGQAGIRVNSVCPGVTRTAMLDRALARDPRREERINQIHPIGRLGEAEEVAQAALWLFSDSASFVTGHQLMVDGGLVAI